MGGEGALAYRSLWVLESLPKCPPPGYTSEYMERQPAKWEIWEMRAFSMFECQGNASSFYSVHVYLTL